MEQEYKIEWLEKKVTSTNKEKADVSLKSATGELVENVTIWADFPDFANLLPGSTIKGTLNPAKDARFGPTLYPPRTPKQAAGANFKTAQIEKVMDRKESSIRSFQDSKEENIRKVSAQRDATLVVTTFFKDSWTKDPILDTELDAMIKRKIIEYRDWFLSEDFNQIIPF